MINKVQKHIYSNTQTMSVKQANVLKGLQAEI